ncbi:S41 family peptidase [Pontibacter sp. H249]|uniref:S41 family peptidase n=1 Tax=Pontibacter sp. H249 TaxID=3133420 RepID=UPI0030C15E17
MRKSLLVIAFVLAAQISFAQAVPDSVKTYIVQALDIMKQNSINKYKIDWGTLYAQTLEEAKDAKTIRDTYPAIKKALASLKDGHSKLYEPEVINALKEMGYESAAAAKMPMPTGNMVDGKYALLTIPGFSAISNKDQLTFVDSIQSVIRILDAQNPKGWIIDLCLNQGGNLEPTIAGLMPVLGEGKSIGWADADDRIEFANYKNGMIIGLIDSTEHFIKNPYTLKKNDLPVAILISSKTASSGEMTAICFTGRKHTKLIGTLTLGLTTGNSPKELTDGAWLNLTNSKAADRNGKIYGGKVNPDINITLTKNAITDHYLYLNAAIKHIEKPRK